MLRFVIQFSTREQSGSMNVLFNYFLGSNRFESIEKVKERFDKSGLQLKISLIVLCLTTHFMKN